jgi:glycosyltransferase involved in cell wall biosynthesis
VSDWYYPKIGGIESHIDHLSELIASRGNEVHILTRKYQDSQDIIAVHDAQKRQKGIIIHRVKGHAVRRWGAVVDPRISWIVNDVIKREKFELIHAHSIYSPMAMVTAYAGKTLRYIPTVATNHSLWGNVLMRSLLKHLLSEEFTRLDALIAVSNAVKEDTERFCKDKPIFVIPNGVDCDNFYPDATNREKIRRYLGFDDKDIVIVTVGRLVPRKKMSELIQITHDLNKRYNVKLLIVGDGPEKEKLVRLSRSLGMNGNVRFTGYVSNPFDYLNASDIFSLCSENEALGISILEAMACELPVVVKDVNGIRDILSGNNGLPPANDAAAIKNNLELLITDCEFRSKLAKNNRKHVLSNFAWDIVCKRTLDVYDFADKVAEAEAPRYYSMKLAKMGRIVRKLKLSHDENRSTDDRY